MSEHGEANVIDPHACCVGDQVKALKGRHQGEFIGVSCSICGHAWLAGESESIEPGKFVREARGVRAQCPLCEAHCRLVW